MLSEDFDNANVNTAIPNISNTDKIQNNDNQNKDVFLRSDNKPRSPNGQLTENTKIEKTQTPFSENTKITQNTAPTEQPILMSANKISSKNLEQEPSRTNIDDIKKQEPLKQYTETRIKINR